jgi:phosphatidylglycerophosphatase A
VNKFILFISSGFGVGYIKYAPGTFGSLVGVICWVLFVPTIVSFHIFALLSITFISVSFASFAQNIYKTKDDKRIVVDEIAGMWFSVAFLPKSLLMILLAFVFFRVLDIKKPWFIGKSQELKSGIGITADDILSGIVVNITLQIVKFAIFAIHN